jgi:radical SAM family uncharacterized protein/radical SAM-linked protein
LLQHGFTRKDQIITKETMSHQLSKKVKRDLLPFVMKPGRYVGNELHTFHKDHQGKLKVALGFPDVYEIGMSYHGLAILYHIINQRPDWVAERAFAPWVDAEETMRKQDIPLFSLESHTPLNEFDVVGFSLAYELNYTNILNMLDLAQIPIWSAERSGQHPLIIAGGPCTLNPEPVADFFDVLAIGDAEEMAAEILSTIQAAKADRASRIELLTALSRIPGVYAPRFYEVKYDQAGKFQTIMPKSPDVPEKIKVRTVPQLKSEYYPSSPIVPFLETIHDRLTIEIMRGCPKRCRFCGATVAYQPKRERPVGDIVTQAERGIADSGWDEISLLSLSTTDYSQLLELTKTLSARLSSKRVSVSLPSLRPSTFSLELAGLLTQVKKPGLTFAPEAGTVRLRNAVGKHLNEEELMRTVRIAFSSGWNLIKLYFMIGLPTETEEDLRGITALLKRVLEAGRAVGGRNNVNVTISPFTPKPHTPFQWERLESIQTLQEKITFLKVNCRRGNVHLKFRDPQVSYLEGILGRGDRRISAVIHAAWKKGAKLDGWTEHFNYRYWSEAFAEQGMSMDSLAQELDPDSPLPWDHIDKGIRKDSLRKERNRAYAGHEEPSGDQTWPCEVGVEDGRAISGLKVSDLAPVDQLQGAVPPAAESAGSSASYGRKRKRKPLSPAMTVARSRVRLKWSKSEEVRFTSHLDVGRIVERAIRRSAIPIAYSEGFHPHQKVAFGPPLPLGFVSDAEYLDIQLSEPYGALFFQRLNSSLPPGFEFLEGRPVLGKSDSLSFVINLATYQVGLGLAPDQAEKSIESIMARANLVVQRTSKEKTKDVDIRRHIVKIESHPLDDGVLLDMHLGLGTDGYARPEEVLVHGFGLSPREAAGLLIKRTGLFVRKRGQILTPMEVV